METNRPLPGGQPRQFGIRNLPPANPPTPIDEYSALIKALLTFDPNIFELVSSDVVSSNVISSGQSFTRSFEITSVEVWERFLATLQPDPDPATKQDSETRSLYNFITSKLRYWIDLHPQDRHCLLHLTMAGLPHDTFVSIFMGSVATRLDALPELFPQNKVYLDKLRKTIIDTRSGSWPRLPHKNPDSTLSFRGSEFGCPGFIFEVGDSQNWDGSRGVKNKAITFIDDSEGDTTAVLYLGYRKRTIAMIGSKHVFPSYSSVNYLDGTASTHAVEVIPLTWLEDPVYTECRLIFKFCYFSARQVLLRSLEPAEQEMGFFFTFREILQMMEMVDKINPSSLRLIDAEGKFDPVDASETEREMTWDSNTSIQAGIFKTPPESLPYALAGTYSDGFVEYLSSDVEMGVDEEVGVDEEKGVDGEDFLPPDGLVDERDDTDPSTVRQSARLVARRQV